MKRIVIFFITGLLLVSAMAITGCTSTQKTQTAPVSAPAPIVKEKQDTTTLGEQNAAKSAKQYLRSSGFSRDGLIKQLEFEGFSHQEAVYGTDQSGANWNEQAAITAKQYLRSSAFSRDGLIKQLEFEGFTSAQAAYGAQAVGY